MTEQRDNPGEPLDGRPNELAACPFCAMLCDDLSLPAHNLERAAADLACPRARDGFTLALGHTARAPSVDGRNASLSQAIAHARRLLESARLPLFHGLLGDLSDCQGALRLAERYGGVVDHADGDAMAVNLALYQDSGWICTSLGETRNRADLVILIGDSIDERLPRLHERLFDVSTRLHTDSAPAVIELDRMPLDTLDQVRTLLRARPLPSPSATAVELHERLLHSRYPVLVPLVGEGRDAELIARSAADLVRILNEKQRAALLMLSPGIGSATAQHASTWHGGFGIRTSFANGYPVQDLRRFAGHRLLTSTETDLLVWISTLHAEPAPACNQPRIVIGHPAMELGDTPPDVFLPVAVPGIHRPGFIHRADGLHMLPLQGLVETSLPRTGELITQLLGTQAGTD
ncbi:MAG: hypothetical protein KDI82_01840 [Gammaproteobacteria bacterium]|nr:hypothetical protein [Gammaproteobacteria bacterium]